MGMNVNFGTGVNSYSQKALPTTAPGYTSSVQSSLLSQPAYDTVSFSGNQISQKQEKEGMSTGAKVGLVAAAATAVIGIWAASRGKKINTANGEATKLWNNITTGAKSLFTKAGRESYKVIAQNSDKLDDAAGAIVKTVSSSNVQDAAKGSAATREALEGLKKQQTELTEKIAKATGDEAKTLTKQLDDLTLKIKDAENPQTLIQEMITKKQAGQDISELQKRLSNISDVNIQAADGKTASLMAKHALQGDEAYTKALTEASELKGKLTALKNQESTLSAQLMQGEANIQAIQEQINKAAGSETLSQLNKLKDEAAAAIDPLQKQLAVLRGTGEGSISAANKALTNVSQPIGQQYNAKRTEILNQLQKDGSSTMEVIQMFFGNK